VLLLFLPPLIYYAGFYSDPRETVEHLPAVIGQSVGLVLVTAGTCAGALLLVFPDVGWAAALAFGAAVAPPDPVAATNVLQRLGVPRRLVTVLEGEGLINDGIALTVFALAVTAVGASPTAGDVGLELLVQIGGGIAIGLVVGVASTWLRRRVTDSASHVVLSLATPYLAFVPAQLVHASGVLATVTAAVWLGTRGRGLVAPTSRMQTETFWRALNVMLVALLFVLLGLQVPAIVAVVGGYPIGQLVAAVLAVLLAAVGSRLIWVMVATPLLARLPVRGGPTAGLSRPERAALAWCGPRGAVSLAVALSIPGGQRRRGAVPAPRPADLSHHRGRVGHAGRAGDLAARRAADAAHGAGRAGTQRDPARPPGDAGRRAARARRGDHRRGPRAAGGGCAAQVLELRRDTLRGRTADGSDADTDTQADERELRLRLLEAERRALRELRADGSISGPTAVEISQELDLDEARLRKRA
jgi:NhaP-type Na+/H+ or K+/H+ antiporter